ncbi:hypothetical protein EVAR_21027_1 [Eumeta japonica]|uniref:Uncharacterized protein n=1 Tax=Eumeta variegata TaxID=151549 RepID=A0A4C1V1N6_EUMVA|nr:hypothetical protein EVAR_21027_1 [Eumeta japonica]
MVDLVEFARIVSRRDPSRAKWEVLRPSSRLETGAAEYRLRVITAASGGGQRLNGGAPVRGRRIKKKKITTRTNRNVHIASSLLSISSLGSIPSGRRRIPVTEASLYGHLSVRPSEGGTSRYLTSTVMYKTKAKAPYIRETSPLARS